MIYKRGLECTVFRNSFQRVCNQTIRTRRKNATDVYFKELECFYTVVKCNGYDLGSLTTKKSKEIIELYNKTCS